MPNESETIIAVPAVAVAVDPTQWTEQPPYNTDVEFNHPAIGSCYMPLGQNKTQLRHGYSAPVAWVKATWSLKAKLLDVPRGERLQVELDWGWKVTIPDIRNFTGATFTGKRKRTLGLSAALSAVQGAQSYASQAAQSRKFGAVVALLQSWMQSTVTCTRCQESSLVPMNAPKNWERVPFAICAECAAGRNQESSYRVDESEDEDDERGGAILASSFNPMLNSAGVPLTTGPTDTGRFYGVELEYECERLTNGAWAVRSAFERELFAKEDGSINHGFEVVSMPATLGWLRAEMPRFFRLKKSHEMKSRDGLGMHVHVSRHGLTALQIVRISTFINSPHNTNLVYAFARRDRHDWAQRMQKRGADFRMIDNGDGSKPKVGQRDSGRYVAVNLQPDNTVEVRIFRSPRTYREFMESLEFCDAVVEFCGSHGFASLTSPTFARWIHNHGHRWPFAAPLACTVMAVPAPKLPKKKPGNPPTDNSNQQ